MLYNAISPSLKEACLILFGPQIEATPDFIRYLQPDGLKSAFRRKALETHPDRALALGGGSGMLNENFLRVVWAYQHLKEVLESPSCPGAGQEDPPVTPVRPVRSHRPGNGGGLGARRAAHQRFFRGALPHRPLRLGEYLYYAGVVSWQDFINSLIWQRKQRPPFGQIALTWNLLTDQQIARIMLHRNFGEKLGEAAVRQGLLKHFWVRTILLRQAKMQPLLGQYFLENGLLDRKNLREHVADLRMHNRHVESQFFGDH